MTFGINARRLLIFVSIILLIGLLLQQYWASKSPEEKWLYIFQYPARDYASKVLGSARGTHVPLPEELSGNEVEIQERYVVFAPKQTPQLKLAFAPTGKPPAPGNAQDWFPLEDGWYVLRAGAANHPSTGR